MPETTVKGIDGLLAALRRDLPKLRRKAHRAARLAAVDTARYVAAKTIPIAFGELRASLHVDASSPEVVRLVADAPHAAAVEAGSRPHTPPLEPLVRWVRLRGMQGLDRRGRVKASKRPGTTTAKHSQSIAATLRAMRVFSAADLAKIERSGRAARSKARRAGKDPATAYHQARERRATFLGSTPADAAVQIAKAIQHAISVRGTKPHGFMLKALPFAREAFGEHVLEELRR